MPATRRQLAKAGEAATPSKAAPADVQPSKRVAEVVVLNPRTTEYEFMGPYIGAIGITLGLPALVWAAAYYCNGGMWPHIPTKLPSLEDITSTFSWDAFAVYVAWWTFQAVLYLVVPGEMKEGLPLRDGSRLRYPINGFRCLLITAVTAALVHVYVHPLTWIADNFVQLTVAAIVFSYGLSVYLYFASFLGGPRAILALGGNSGVPLYDFFIGRELNPRVLGGRLDLKYFCELRPGLFGWVLINTAMLLRQVETQGAVSPAMAIVYALQALYVADSVYCEDCILSTIDIIQDGFGFMLVFGDLAWVPAMYSLQARYLAEVPVHLSAPYAALCLAVGVAGFYIFRAANAQKDAFKKNPEDEAVRDLPFIKTKTGSRLLAGGWWGTSRHINYFGDWLLSVGMSLPTWFGTPITYFYPVYFAVLLAHREVRDEHKCAAKYGAEWQEYKRRVPYRIIPYVY